MYLKVGSEKYLSLMKKLIQTCKTCKLPSFFFLFLLLENGLNKSDGSKYYILSWNRVKNRFICGERLFKPDSFGANFYLTLLQITMALMTWNLIILSDFCLKWYCFYFKTLGWLNVPKVWKYLFSTEIPIPYEKLCNWFKF